LNETILDSTEQAQLTEVTREEILSISGSSTVVATTQVSEYPEIENDPPG
jgi:hypothetical protein